jgi:hypothetical protein
VLLSGFVVDVAHVDVAKPCLMAMSRARVRVSGRGVRFVEHLPVGVEGGEMERHVDAEVLADPRTPRRSRRWSRFRPGINKVVISNQTLVSRFRYTRVSSTAFRRPAHAPVEVLGQPFKSTLAASI